MSLRSRIEKVGGGTSANYSTTWTRPADWIAMPDLTSYNQAVGMLVAVFNDDSNFLAIRCTAAFSIDYGDGTGVHNYATGTLASYTIAWANISSGTLTSQGYRQAKVIVSPQAGNSISIFRCNEKNTSDTNTSTSSSYGILEIQVKDNSHLSTCSIGTSSTTNNSIPRMLQRVQFTGSNTVADLSSSFQGCSGLIQLDLPSSVTTLSSTFRDCKNLLVVNGLSSATLSGTAINAFLGCARLQVAPSITPLGSCNNMFQDCLALADVSALTLTSITSATSMFQGCLSLVSIPAFNLNACTTATSMFQSCTALIEVPLFTNTTSITSCAQLFASCTALRTCAALDLRGATTANSVFSGCTSLTDCGLIDTRANTTFLSFFANCSSLVNPPVLNTAAGTNFQTMFQNCISMAIAPAINTASGTTFTSMFSGCTNLQIAPALNMAAATTAATLFATCRSMSAGLLANPPAVDHSYIDCRLAAADLNAIFTALAVVVGKTITITNNWGSAGSTKTIATLKGWTVTG